MLIYPKQLSSEFSGRNTFYELKTSKSNIQQYHLHKLHPEKLQFEVYPLNSYRKENQLKAAVPHSHSFYQIIWFKKGVGKHFVDFQSYQIEDNTILFIAKDQIHYFDEHLTIEGWMIHFNESFFMQNDVDIFLKFNVFNAQQNPRYTLNPDASTIANAYLSLILDELKNKSAFGHADVLRFLLKSFLINIERLNQDETKKKIEKHSPYELQYYVFRSLVEDNYQLDLSINEYADLLNVSPKTLGTITKQVVNKSPSQVIAERVVIAAKRLLKFTPLQIGEIAYRLGFKDDSYFIKYFKKHVGSSPKYFRQKGMH